MSDNGAHPSSPLTTVPVSLSRVERAIRVAGFEPLLLPEHLVVMHDEVAHSVIIAEELLDAMREATHAADAADAATDAGTHSGAVAGGAADTSRDPDAAEARRRASRRDRTTPTAFHVITHHHTPLSFSDTHAIAEFTNDWNHDCLTPHLYADFSRPDCVRVEAVTVLDTAWGMTDAQLAGAVQQALRNAEAFIEALRERFPLINATAPVSTTDVAIGEGTSDAIEDQVYAVDTARIADVLAGVGIDKLRHVDDESIYAWINEVLFGFVIDNGPTLLVKGHWDPDLTGRDFMRVFLICNDINRTLDDAVAYCHSNVEGLQVRIDITNPIAHGLSDRQLRRFISRALRTVLHSIDAIARETTGESPVQWP